MCYAQSHTVDDWHTDSTFLEKPGSNICYLSNSADSRGHENTGKGTRKADERGMSSEKEERRIQLHFEGREYRKQGIQETGLNGVDSPWKGNKQNENEYGKKISTRREEHL